MDVRYPAETAGHPPGDSTARCADGGGESVVGLQADSKRTGEHEAPCGALDDPPDPEGGGPSARSPAADLMADVPEIALGCHRRGGLLHDRSVDLPGVSDVLHGVR